MAGTLVLVKHQSPIRANGVSSDGIGYLEVLATADASDGTFPATALDDLVTSTGAPGRVWFEGTLLVLATNPGSPAPTNGYGITLVDSDGLDRLDGAGATLSDTESERRRITGDGIAALSEALTLTIEDNLVNSAVITIRLYYQLGVGSSDALDFDPDGDLGVHDTDVLATLDLILAAVEDTQQHEAGTALASAARTIATNSADIDNTDGHLYVDVVVDVTAIVDTPSLTVTIQGKDELSGKYYTLLVSAAITTVSTNIYRIGPGLTAAANAVANFAVPKTWRVSVAVADADSATYSVGYCLMG